MSSFGERRVRDSGFAIIHLSHTAPFFNVSPFYGDLAQIGLSIFIELIGYHYGFNAH
jgi:hypothetical protein